MAHYFNCMYYAADEWKAWAELAMNLSDKEIC